MVKFIKVNDKKYIFQNLSKKYADRIMKNYFNHNSKKLLIHNNTKDLYDIIINLYWHFIFMLYNISKLNNFLSFFSLVQLSLCVFLD